MHIYILYKNMYVSLLILRIDGYVHICYNNNCQRDEVRPQGKADGNDTGYMVG